MSIGSGTYAYDKTFNIVPAAQNMSIVPGGTGWFDLIDYKGNLIRFHTEQNCPNGGTLTGDVQTNSYSDYKGDVNPNTGTTPSHIVMISPGNSGYTAKKGLDIARVINGDNGFGQFGGTMIAISFDMHSSNVYPGNYNWDTFNDPVNSINATDWTTIGSHFDLISSSVPAGSGFNNTQIDAGVSNKLKILVMQNNPVKVNNFNTSELYGFGYLDGNNPISYGEPTSGALFASGEQPVSMVGGKFEMIKAYLPFSTLTGADTNNPPNPKQIITGVGVPLATLGSGANYAENAEHQVLDASLNRSGCTWGKDMPEYPSGPPGT